jgi:hypothetical protein
MDKPALASTTIKQEKISILSEIILLQTKRAEISMYIHIPRSHEMTLGKICFAERGRHRGAGMEREERRGANLL